MKMTNNLIINTPRESAAHVTNFHPKNHFPTFAGVGFAVREGKLSSGKQHSV